MIWLYENIWMLLTIFMVAVFIWTVYSHHKKTDDVEDLCGTLHCPYCGETVGFLKNGESATDLFFVEEEVLEEDGDLPDNVIPFTQRATPLFVVDDDNDTDGPYSS